MADERYCESVKVGGGYDVAAVGLSPAGGCTITNAGVVSANGAGYFDGNLRTEGTLTADGASTLTGEVQVGGGYGSTGVTISTAGNIQANGTLTIDGASTLTGEVQVGGGYGSTGATLSTAGNLQMNGNLTADGTSTLTGDTTFGDGYGSSGATLTAASGNFATKGTLTVDSTSTLTGDATFAGSILNTGAATNVGVSDTTRGVVTCYADNNITGGKLTLQAGPSASPSDDISIEAYNGYYRVFTNSANTASIRFQNVGAGDLDVLCGADLEIDGDLNHDGSNAGFYGTAPIAKPDVSGSRGGNAALADLLTELENLGLITDSTT